MLATFGRTAEVDRFFASLVEQGYRDCHVVVADQNPDDRLEPIIRPYEGVISYSRLCCSPGLSRSRNLALERVDGDLVAFPDDDCWYPPGYLARIAAWFQAHPEFGGLTSRAVDAQGEPLPARWSRRAGEVNRSNVWTRCCGPAMFYRRDAVQAAGGFDEQLGPGSGTPWPAAEDMDFPLRVLAAGYRIHYDPAFAVRHPQPVVAFDENACLRAYRYGMGMGRVMRLHRYPLWFVFYHLLRPAGGAALALLTARPAQASFHANQFVGRVRGWAGRSLYERRSAT